MRFRVCANPACGMSESQISNLVMSGASEGKIIHHGRNLIRLVDCEPYPITIKRFSTSIKNRIVYSMRESKARRSYENALELIRRGFDTPLPYGYTERRNTLNILLCSNYICQYEERLTLYEAILSYGRECLAAFAGFVASLHLSGIRHDDLNNSNVRVYVGDNHIFHFSLIDLNRMKIYRDGEIVPEKECFKNICRFSRLDNDYIYFVMKYIEARNMSSEKADCAVIIKKKHDRHVDAKKWFKDLIKLQYI